MGVDQHNTIPLGRGAEVIMEFINNILKGSWLYNASLLGLNGWWWLLIGFSAVAVFLVTMVLVFNARANNTTGRISTRQAERARVLRTLFLFLLAAAVFVALLLIWPDLWFWPTAIFGVLFVAALVLFMFYKFVKAAAILVIAALVGALLAFGIQLQPSLDPNAPKADCAAAVTALEESGLTLPYYFNLEPNKPLNTFGTDPGMRDEAGLLQALHDRRCVDPALTSAHLATWGVIGVNLIDEYTARFNTTRELWLQAIGTMEQLEKESMDYAKEQAKAFALEAVPTGKSSLYMESDGSGGVRVKLGVTVSDGNALVFTHPDGRVIKLRIECGFQPVFDTPPPGLPECEDGNNCIPDECPPWYPHGNPETGCKDDPSADPGPNGNAPIGSGPNADPGPGVFIPEEEMEQPGGEPRVNPDVPIVVATQPPVVVVQQPPPAPVVVVPEEQPVNNGVVPTNPTPAQPCNPEFQSCP